MVAKIAHSFGVVFALGVLAAGDFLGLSALSLAVEGVGVDRFGSVDGHSTDWDTGERRRFYLIEVKLRLNINRGGGQVVHAGKNLDGRVRERLLLGRQYESLFALVIGQGLLNETVEKDFTEVEKLTISLLRRLRVRFASDLVADAGTRQFAVRTAKEVLGA